MSRPSHPSLFVFLTLASIGSAQPVASGTALALDPVVVTAQKRDQSIDEVPLPITAYTGSQLADLGVGQLADLGVGQLGDLAPLVPGLFVSTQSPASPSINLRGIGTDTTDPRQEPRVSIFQDGVGISRAAGSAIELFDLERVEVLKGPQGTLFGRNAGTGAIAFVSRRPADATESALTLGAGNYHRTHAAGYVNTPLVRGQLLARGLHDRTPRWIRAESRRWLRPREPRNVSRARQPALVAVDRHDR